MSEDKKSFGEATGTLLAGFAAIVTAATGLYITFGPKDSGGISFDLKAVIEDPDGFTHVRSIESKEGVIVTTIYEGEVFNTYTQNINRWQVKTQDGKVGYKHVSRIQIISE